jgi:hypothetical protein
MTQRTCKKCSQVKELSEFANAGIVKGIPYKRHLCIPCYSESKKPRKLKCRQDYYDWKKTLSCECCGFDDHRALHFHHINDDKENTVSIMMCRGFSLENIKKEAAKCIVLCANCHAIEHFNGM